MRKILIIILISLALFNCESENHDLISKQIELQTASLDEVKSSLMSWDGSFNKSLHDSIFRIYPEMSTLHFETLDNSNVQSINVETITNSINIDSLTYRAINYNNVLFESLEYSTNVIYDPNGEIIHGDFIYFNLDGKFRNGFRVENYSIDKELKFMSISEANVASFLAILFQSDECDEDLDPNSIFCLEELDAIVIGGDPPPGNNRSALYYSAYYNPVLNTIDAGPSGNGSVHCGEGQVRSPDGARCFDIPCYDEQNDTGDPLDEMNVLGTLNNGVAGGRYGNARGYQHDGIDLAAPFGTPVFATHDGVIAHAPFVNNWTPGDNDAGNRIYFNFNQNGQNVQLGYWHLGEILVQPGQQVTRGQLIGFTGDTGNVSARGSAGPHLHVRARVNGQPSDPEPHFATDFDNQGNTNNNCNQ